MSTEEMSGTESRRSLRDYWNHHKHEIANERGWDCKRESCPHSCLSECSTGSTEGPKGVDCHAACRESCWRHCPSMDRIFFCSTMTAYDGYIDKLSKYLPHPIADLSFDDIKHALESIRTEFGYADTTVRSIQPCISIIFRFAESRGDAFNIMKYTSAKGIKKDILALLTSNRPKKAIQEALTHERERYHHKTKSLTIWQLEKLGEILWKSIETDGRYCMIALMLYTGIRPAEGRALFWHDIVPFLDHPDRMILQLYRTRDKNGVLHDRMKTSNAYRRIPIHHELMQLLNKRLAFLKREYPGLNIGDMPICCYGNEVQRPCCDYEVAQLADEIFSKRLKLKQMDMYIYMLEAEAEKLSGKSTAVADRDQQLTLYVLRRNFWTWIEALTSLSEYEKRYIMGHEMKLNGHSIRFRFNDENRLWEICRKMDHCVIVRQLHEASLCVVPERGMPILVENRGLFRIRLTREVLAAGGELQIYATTEEAGEAIRLTCLSALRQYGGLTLQAEVFPHPIKHEPPIGINCEYENWQAHLNPSPYCQEEGESESGSDVSEPDN